MAHINGFQNIRPVSNRNDLFLCIFEFLFDIEVQVERAEEETEGERERERVIEGIKTVYVCCVCVHIYVCVQIKARSHLQDIRNYTFIQCADSSLKSLLLLFFCRRLCGGNMFV